MANFDPNLQPPATGNGFRISPRPVIRTTDEEEQVTESGAVVQLPRVPGPPLLFAIARDPRTIFAYWDVDWRSVFLDNPPVDRQVHLRVYRADGSEESSAPAEPMAGSCYLKVEQPRGAYRVEIGFYHPQNSWNLIATSEEVTMPPDSVSEQLDVDLATVPFHLSFQRLIDVYRASNKDALTEIIGRLQRRALSKGDPALVTPEEREIMHATDLSLDELRSARDAFSANGDGGALRKRAEAILGLGSTSPSRAFGGSSSA